MRHRRLLVLFSVAAICLAATEPSAGHATPGPARSASAPRPGWVAQIDRLVRSHQIGVAVRESDELLYGHGQARRRAPASNEKLLLSMSILAALGPDARLVTTAAAPAAVAGVVPGDLWILGQGDPSLDEERMQDLARAVAAAGVVRVDGRVMGSRAYFKRDWRAPGWKRDFPKTQVALPTALTFEGNTDRGIHVTDPEERAAKALTEALEDRGVSVAGKPDAGVPPEGLVALGEIESRPLIQLLEYTNRYSSNFYAEVLGKRLGAEQGGTPGSIRKGADAMTAWATDQGVAVRAHDASGLSYANRLSPSGLVRLLDAAEDQPWGEALREALPVPGQGTLAGRLRHLDVHAKTGTLTAVSALSGWVFLRRAGVWAEFSILSRGLSKDAAVRIEDRIVRILCRLAA